ALAHQRAKQLVKASASGTGILGVAIFVPGADFPVLTLNQIRLVLRLAAAHGAEREQKRAPEVLAPVAAGFGSRAFARQLLGAIPFGDWAVKGGVAYGGTRALGEGAWRYLQSVSQD